MILSCRCGSGASVKGSCVCWVSRKTWPWLARGWQDEHELRPRPGKLLALARISGKTRWTRSAKPVCPEIFVRKKKLVRWACTAIRTHKVLLARTHIKSMHVSFQRASLPPSTWWWTELLVTLIHIAPPLRLQVTLLFLPSLSNWCQAFCHLWRCSSRQHLDLL